MNLNQKKEIANDLSERFSKASIAIVTDFKGLDVATMTELRRKLREESVDYKVVKNTLLIRAAENTDIALMKDYFKGPSAIALSYDDPVIPAKILDKFAGDNDKFEIKAAVMKGKLLDNTAIKALSKLPSREVLLGQMLSAMNAVPTGFVRLLSQVPQSLVNVLQAIKDQKEAV